MKETSNLYCGECPFFKHEDTCGNSFCAISDREQRCDDACSFLTFDLYMTIKQARKILGYRGKIPPLLLNILSYCTLFFLRDGEKKEHLNEIKNLKNSKK